MKLTRRHVSRLGGLTLLTLLVSGCGESGPATYPVNGLVLFDDQPVPNGVVMFIPKEGPATTSKIVDGTYQLEAAAGRHRVTVIAREQVEVFNPFSPDFVPPKSLVPMKYAKPLTSNIDVDVSSTDSNTIDIRLGRSTGLPPPR